ncbi:MAG: Crp/Fnr family transcriptional regulator [Gammaproteobacteria bacterium]
MNSRNPSWLAAFPALEAIEDQAWRAAAAAARVAMFPPGAALYQSGEDCTYFILIIEGAVKVEKVSESGQEITLYHLRPGQICELTTSCLMGGRCYHADAVAETAVRAALIPKAAFQEALGRSEAFRTYVYDTVEQGMSGLLSLLESVISTPTGRRLAHHLVMQKDSDHTIKTTHHEIAAELGTAREVISRLLKEFEHHGWLRLHRGRIDIVDPDALRRLAEGKAED